MTTVVRVKICGLTRTTDVSDAIDCGADALGFVFGYSRSPRNLSFERLKKLTRGVPPYVSTVVVSPVSNPFLAKVIEEVRPSFLQLYSDNEPASPKGIRQKLASFGNVIETIHPPVSDDGSSESTTLRCKHVSKYCKGILLDSPLTKPKRNSGGRSVMITPGGSGTIHNWRLSRKVRDALFPFPVILGGGLNERNVQRAIEEVKPFAVDVSSGVESSPGVKDKIKLRRFIENAKTA